MHQVSVIVDKHERRIPISEITEGSKLICFFKEGDLSSYIEKIIIIGNFNS